MPNLSLAKVITAAAFAQEDAPWEWGEGEKVRAPLRTCSFLHRWRGKGLGVGTVEIKNLGLDRAKLYIYRIEN